MATPGPLFIGIAGRKYSGKTTFAKILSTTLQALGVPVANDAFAARMKKVAAEIFGVYGLGDELNYEKGGYGEGLKETPLAYSKHSPRDIWIALGNAMRKLEPNVWTWNVLQGWKGFNGVVIISDVRYQNEADAILSEGGEVYRLCRHDSPPADDPAEQSAENLTRVVGMLNTGTLEELERAAEFTALDVKGLWRARQKRNA